MKVDSFLQIARNQLDTGKSQEQKKEKTASEFEKLFAKNLVKELTKDSFKMSDNEGVMGHSNNLYREYITNALAGELAAQRKLGMADLITKYWNQTSGSTEGNS